MKTFFPNSWSLKPRCISRTTEEASGGLIESAQEPKDIQSCPQYSDQTPEDSEVSYFKSVLVSSEISQSPYGFILNQLATLFSTVNLDEDPVKHMRSFLQFLVVYSIDTADVAWLSRKEILLLEESINELESLMCQTLPIVDVSSSVSMDNCLYLANLLEIDANIKLVRVSIIRMLPKVIASLDLSRVFKLHSLDKNQFTQNATSTFFAISSKSCQLTHDAFCLITNAYATSHEPFPGCIEDCKKTVEEEEEEGLIMLF